MSAPAYPVIAAIFFIVSLIGAGAVASAAIWFELRPWRKAAQAHWTERARLIQPVRSAVATNSIVLAGVATLVSLLVDPTTPFGWATGGAMAGALLAGFSLSRQVFPTLKFTAWLRTLGIALLFVALNWGTLIVAIFLMPAALSWETWLLAGSCLTIFLALQCGLGVRLLRALGTLRPASARVQRLVDETSAQVGLRARAVWEIVTPAANAHAYVTLRQLGFTTGLVEIATDAELKAVCAHELAHLRESRAVIAARVAGRALVFLLMFIRPIEATWPNAGVPALLAIMAVAFFGVRRMSQAMERKADKAALQSAADPRDYVRALEKIHALNLIPAVLHGQRLLTHPNLYDRLLAANIPVSYERPKKPKRFVWSSIALAVVFGVLVGIAGGVAHRRHVVRSNDIEHDSR